MVEINRESSLSLVLLEDAVKDQDSSNQVIHTQIDAKENIETEEEA